MACKTGSKDSPGDANGTQAGFQCHFCEPWWPCRSFAFGIGGSHRGRWKQFHTDLASRWCKHSMWGGIKGIPHTHYGRYRSQLVSFPYEQLANDLTYLPSRTSPRSAWRALRASTCSTQALMAQRKPYRWLLLLTMSNSRNLCRVLGVLAMTGWQSETTSLPLATSIACTLTTWVKGYCVASLPLRWSSQDGEWRIMKRYDGQSRQEAVMIECVANVVKQA